MGMSMLMLLQLNYIKSLCILTDVLQQITFVSLGAWPANKDSQTGGCGVRDGRACGVQTRMARHGMRDGWQTKQLVTNL